MSKHLRPAMVLDPRVMLHPYGMAIASRLTSQFDLWIPRELVNILRNTTAYRERPEMLCPKLTGGMLRRVDMRAEEEAVKTALNAWSGVTVSADYARFGFHWLGDNQGIESTTGLAHPQLNDRFERLARVLDRLIDGSKYDLPRAMPLIGCYRDAFALAGALSTSSFDLSGNPHPALILTRLETDELESPAICEYASAWQLDVAKAPTRPSRQVRAMIDRAQLQSIKWAKASFIGVYVTLPHLWPPLPPDDDALVAIVRSGVYRWFHL